METNGKNVITVAVTVNAPLEKVWELWTQPEHIKQWCYAVDSWHAPHAENDLRPGGKFKTTMAAKDGSAGFDFEGVYSNVEEHKRVEYGLADGRQVKINFEEVDGKTKVEETFDPEKENPEEMQKGGWQGILDNFKKYVETN